MARQTYIRGFTLIELIITILISAIIAVGVISYIGDSVSGFASSSSRNRLASSGRVAVDRLALELYNAVPNSIRVSPALPNGDQCLEFVPFVAATNYIDAPFIAPGGTLIEAVDFNPLLTAASPAGLYAVIYPVSTDNLYAFANPGPIALVDEVEDIDGADGRVTLTLDSSHRFSGRSPVDRLYVTSQPVSFCITGSSMYRYQNYGFEATQCTSAINSCDAGSTLPNRTLPASLPDRMLITDQLNNAGLTAFRVLDPTLRRNAIIGFDLNFTAMGDVVKLKHEVQLRNVP